MYDPKNVFRRELLDQMLSITAESRSFVAVGEQWHKDDLSRGDPIFGAVKPLSRFWRRMAACL